MRMEERDKKATDALIDVVLSISKAKLSANRGALKRLHALEDAPHPEGQEERIQREIEAMSKVSHPNLLKLLDSDGGQRWFVAEYHENGTLTKRQKHYEGKVEAALRAIRPVVEGVAELHESGLVHRDIKPDNIFVAADNRLVLGDFGLIFFDDDDHRRVSLTFENIGSRPWMPMWAQNLRIENVPPAFDVYCLGKVIWWMVANRPPFNIWYYDRPENNLEKLFPQAEHTALVNRLLGRCVCQEEEDCLPHASALLDEIDECLSRIATGHDLMVENDKPKCRACDVGIYNLNIDRDNNGARNFGLNPSSNRSFKIYACNNCGHVQLFYFGTDRVPPAWQGEKPNPGGPLTD